MTVVVAISYHCVKICLVCDAEARSASFLVIELAGKLSLTRLVKELRWENRLFWK